MAKSTDRRFPKVLGDQLVLAIRCLDRLGISGRQQDDLLQLARRAMLHALVAGCFDNPPIGEISAPRISCLESELTSALADRTVTDQALIFDALPAQATPAQSLFERCVMVRKQRFNCAKIGV